MKPSKTGKEIDSKIRDRRNFAYQLDCSKQETLISIANYDSSDKNAVKIQ